MRTTIDASGRLVIPKRIRDQAGFKPGAPLELRLRDGLLEIESAPADVRFVKSGKITVAVLETDEAPMTQEEVNTVREQIRAERE